MHGILVLILSLHYNPPPPPIGYETCLGGGGVGLRGLRRGAGGGAWKNQGKYVYILFLN